MKKAVSYICALLLVVFLCGTTALAVPVVTAAVNKATAQTGDTITVSGTAPADTWISIKGLDDEGSIVYFSAALSAGAGNYSHAFMVPEMADGTLTLVAGFGSTTASATVTVYTPSGGGGTGGGATQTDTDTQTTVSDDGKSTDTDVHGTTDSTGKTLKACLTSDDVKSLLDKASGSSGGLSGIKTITFDVDSAGSVTQVALDIPAASFKELADKTSAGVTVSTSLGSVTFNAKAVDSIAKAGTSGDVSISITKLDSSELPPAVKSAIGNRPVFDFTVTSGGKTVSSFGGGSATVSVPYTLAPGENPNKIVIYYISDSSALVKVKNCKYDPATGTVTFTTTHFSEFAVAYSDVSFTDVSGWYAEDVNFLAARGVMNGPGGGLFNPNATITRAEFVTILANMSGDDLTRDTSSSFGDVKTTDWFFGAVQWASAKGVASGFSGAFSPNATVTRQDIAVMLARYAEKVAAFTLPEAVTAVSFSDSGKIAPYARDAVSAMQRAGVISGNSDGSFAPAAPATRAEAAKMVAVLVRLMAG
jgi:hypothetical protein